jgi:hypothetical protein
MMDELLVSRALYDLDAGERPDLPGWNGPACVCPFCGRFGVHHSAERRTRGRGEKGANFLDTFTHRVVVVDASPTDRHPAGRGMKGKGVKRLDYCRFTAAGWIQIKNGERVNG